MDDGAAGVARVVRLVLSRPARLGAVRLVAVDGPSGSGKTSLAGPLARALAGAMGGEVIRPRRSAEPRTVTADGVSSRMTSFPPAPHAEPAPPAVPPEEARPPRVAVVSTDLLATWEHPLDWWPVLEEHLLAPLAAGRVATLPVVEWVSGNPRPGGHIAVPAVDVLVLEGVSSGRRAVDDRLTALVWIEIADRAARLERSVARDGEAMRPYLTRWQTDEDRHFATDGTRKRADVVIAPGDVPLD